MLTPCPPPKLIKPYVRNDSLILIQNALVQPYFQYRSLVCQNCKLELQLKLQKLQNRAARVITGDNWEISLKDVLNKLSWQPLDHLGLINTLLFVRKILKRRFPCQSHNSFTFQ